MFERNFFRKMFWKNFDESGSPQPRLVGWLVWGFVGGWWFLNINEGMFWGGLSVGFKKFL